jgi:hypothetical protein
VIRDGYRYIVSRVDPPRERLHRLGDETHDLTRSEPDVLNAMRRQLAIEQRNLERMERIPQQISPEDLERLKALGYVPSDP